MTSKPIFGLYAAMVTPFLPSGKLDIERATNHAKKIVAEGCDGITLFGTTGEGYGINATERQALLVATRQALPNATPICVGVMSSDISYAAEQALAAYAHGATHLLMAPPFFMKNVDDEGLFHWFSEVFEQIGEALKNVILYHIPGQTAVPLSAGLISRLRAAFPGIITGIKDSSGDWSTTQEYLSAHGDIAILVGDERLLAKAMAHGAQGSICGTANFMPAQLRNIIHDGSDGALVSQIVDLVVSHPVTPAVKVLTSHVNDDPEFKRVRPPLSPIDDATSQALIEEFKMLFKTVE